MNTKPICVGLCALFFALCPTAEAQQATKVPRVGLLTLASHSSTSPSFVVQGFREGIRELGYVEGQNILIEYRSADGKVDRLPHLAAELVRLNLDILVAAGGAEPALAAKKATKTLPIVFTSVADPVESGLVASVARPGGNITGLTTIAVELSGKRLELLKETIRSSLVWLCSGIQSIQPCAKLSRSHRQRPERWRFSFNLWR